MFGETQSDDVIFTVSARAGVFHRPCSLLDFSVNPFTRNGKSRKSRIGGEGVRGGAGGGFSFSFSFVF